MKKMMTIMKMKTMEEVDMEIRGEAREMMEEEAATIEVQEDIALMMKITMTKIIMMKTMMRKMMTEVAGEEATVEIQVAVPAEDSVP